MYYDLPFLDSRLPAGVLSFAAALFAFSWWRQVRQRGALLISVSLLLFSIGEIGQGIIDLGLSRFFLHEVKEPLFQRTFYLIVLMGAFLLPYALWRLSQNALRTADEQAHLEASDE